MANRVQRRASPARYPKTLDEWDHDRVLKGVEIPSASGGKPMLVDFELPNLTTFAKLGDIPNPLAEIALKAEWDTSFNFLELKDGERGNYFDLMCYVIAWGLRRPNVVEEKGSLEAAAEWVSHWTIEQQGVLWLQCQHIVSRAELQEGANKEVEVENVADLGKFRREPDGPDVSADGADAGGGA